MLARGWRLVAEARRDAARVTRFTSGETSGGSIVTLKWSALDASIVSCSEMVCVTETIS
jgi:hypothetical protein